MTFRPLPSAHRQAPSGSSSRRHRPSPVLSAVFCLLLASLGALLTGCSNSVIANIGVRHSLDNRKGVVRYAFAPLKDQEENIDNSSYRNAIRKELQKRRYIETSTDDAALLLFFSYGINDGKEKPREKIFTTTSYTEYQRGLWVFLAEKGENGAEGKTVYEGSIMAAGELNLVANLMPSMIHALLDDFPGTSGTLRQQYIRP